MIDVGNALLEGVALEATEEETEAERVEIVEAIRSTLSNLLFVLPYDSNTLESIVRKWSDLSWLINRPRAHFKRVGQQKLHRARW